MEMIAVSYAELLRNGVHALRGLGYSFSTAERGAHTLAASQAATGTALNALRLMGQQPRAPLPKAVITKEHASGCLSIDAGGRCLLELAPLLLDALVADAKRYGCAELMVENCRDMPFVVDFAARSRHLTDEILCLYQGALDEAVMGGFATAGGAVVGGRMSAAEMALALAESSRFPERATEFITAQGTPGRVVLLAQGQETSRGRSLAVKFSHTENWQDAETWLPSIDRAIKGQLFVAPEDFAFFMHCVAKVWVPTSERSRSQQG
ncbi:hypothetical protein FHS85_002238 [Rhodoligotrophos appendicifer]|uniref:hypothetical protein n=1 Tax=Rhodoligotrophos appendicifer TaxID=987056 RepID=UPI001186AF2D|nr:hypothetical protein [Rhodoligotrophos appendicifer]